MFLPMAMTFTLVLCYMHMSNVYSRGYSGSSNNLAHASSLKCKNPIRLPDSMWKGESKKRDKGSGSKEQGKVVE